METISLRRKHYLLPHTKGDEKYEEQNFIASCIFMFNYYKL